jgi:predicted component of type VI protein secretion system
MKAKLVVVGSKTNKPEVELELPTVIGRGSEATLRISHPMISRRHCRLYARAGELWIQDLNSSNGTFVAGQRITDVALPPGGEFTIGPLTFRACYQREELSGQDREEPAAVEDAVEDIAVPAPASFDVLSPLPDETPGAWSDEAVQVSPPPLDGTEDGIEKGSEKVSKKITAPPLRRAKPAKQVVAPPAVETPTVEPPAAVPPQIVEPEIIEFVDLAEDGIAPPEKFAVRGTATSTGPPPRPAPPRKPKQGGSAKLVKKPAKTGPPKQKHPHEESPASAAASQIPPEIVEPVEFSPEMGAPRQTTSALSGEGAAERMEILPKIAEPTPQASPEGDSALRAFLGKISQG